MRPGRQGVATQQTRGDIQRHQQALDEQGTRAAHRIAQHGVRHLVARPVRAGEQGGGQGLLERCLSLFGAVIAAVQAGAGQVDAQAQAIFLDDGMNQQVRVLAIDIRTRQAVLAELVDDGVLDLLGNELCVDQLRSAAGRTDGKRLAGPQVITPIDNAGHCIQIVGT